MKPGVMGSEVFGLLIIRVLMLAQYPVGSCLVKSPYILASEETLDSLDLLSILLEREVRVPWFLEVLLGVPTH